METTYFWFWLWYFTYIENKYYANKKKNIFILIAGKVQRERKTQAMENYTMIA